MGAVPPQDIERARQLFTRVDPLQPYDCAVFEPHHYNPFICVRCRQQEVWHVLYRIVKSLEETP